MDSKYGRIFTEQDVVNFVKYVLENAVVDQPEAALATFEGKFPADEPLFVLRGQDHASAETIDEYLFTVKTSNAPEDFIKQVTEARDAFYDFAQTHRERMKFAD